MTISTKAKSDASDEEKGQKWACHCEGVEFRVCLFNLKQFLSWTIWSTIFYRIWQYRRRNLSLTVFQLLIPPLLVLFWIGIHSTLFTHSNHVKTWTKYGALTELELLETVCGKPCDTSQTKYILYFPESDFNNKIIGELESSLGPFNIKFLPAGNEKDLLKYAVLHHLVDKPQLYIGGIHFHDDGKTQVNKPPIQLQATIRMANKIPYEVTPMSTFDYSINQPKNYYQFMGLQLGLFRAYEKVIRSSPGLSGSLINPFQIQIESYPLPPHTEYKRIDGHSCNTELIIQLIFVLGMIPTVFSIIRGPVYDKESGFKLYLRLMGFPRWAYWMSWILNDVIIQIIVVSFQIMLLFLQLDERIGKIVKQGDFAVWFALIFMYSLSSICFLAFIASFFKRGIMGSYVGATIWLLTFYFLDLYGPTYVISLGRVAKLSMCLVPNGALIWALTLLTSDSSGTSLMDLVHPLDTGEVSLFLVLVMLGCDCILYFVLTLYSDNIHPGDHESRQPWNYFFQGVRCTCRERKSKHRKQSVLDNLEKAFGQARLEGGPRFHISESVVEFQDITKKFRGRTVAVKDVNMRIFDSQCTVILGHHGSGKSTLFRLLCGEYYPSSGTVFIKHEDIRRNPVAVQQNLSICLAKDLLSAAHTVMDHMLLVGRLKGLEYSTSMEKAKNLLEQFELENHANYLPDELVNYERRRLCIAMSLMGENNIILLDDPTVGLDEAMKRQIWDILLKLRRQKTIIAVTSDIDEAHYLGDRIAIMSKGRIVAAGSPQMLQKLFATGYHLHLNIQPTANRANIIDFITDSIHNVDVVTNRSRRISRGVAMMMCLVDTESQQLIVNSFKDKKMEFQFPFDDPHDEHNLVCDISGRYLESESVFGNVVDGIEEVVDEQGDTELENPLQMVVQLRIAEGSNFTGLFSKLEDDGICTRLGIVEHKLKLNDLETAFEMIDSHNDSEELNELLYETHLGSESVISLKKTEMFPQTGITFHMQQMRGLLMKRFWWMGGHWLYVFMVQMFVPVLLLLITIQSTDLLYGSSPGIVEISYNMKEMFPKTKVIYKLENPSANAKSFLNIFKKELITHLGYAATLDIGNDDFQKFLSKGSQDEDTVKTNFAKYSLGMKINGDVITALFSPMGFHTGPMSLGLVLNSTLKYTFPGLGYNIHFNSLPFETTKQKLLKFYGNKGVPYDVDPEVSYAIMLGFGFFIFVSNFVTQPLAERLTKLKGLQMNTSVGFFKYWLSFLIIDFTLSLILGGILLCCLLFSPKYYAFRDLGFAKHFMAYWSLSSYTSILLSYIFSFYFRRAKTGYYAMLSVNQCAGLFTFVLSRTISTSVGQRLSRLAFRLFQPYNVPAGFCSLLLQAVENSACDLLSSEVKDVLCNGNKLYQNEINRLDQSCCEKICRRKGYCKDTTEYFDWSHFEQEKMDQKFTFDYVSLFSHAILLTFALIIIEKGVTKSLFKKTYHHRHSKKSLKVNATDLSAEEETKNVHQLLQLRPEERNRLFIMKDICKITRKKECLANLNLVAEPGKLLAICGPSSSGKSIVFNILARLIRTNNGNVYYNGQSLVSWNYSNLLRKIGFCPNIDITLRKLSGLQMLKLFGRLRGIPESELNTHVNQWLRCLELKKRARQHCELYPNSMKRKLAFAVAAIGDPNVIILDNPFKDVNPESRSQLQNVIQDLLSFDRIVILTTDDIRDIKDFNNKTAFLVNGKIECVISPELTQEDLLKGFTLVIKLRIHPEDVTFDNYAQLKTRILKDLPDSYMVEELQNVYKYHIEDKDYKWSTLFTLLENIKSEFKSIVEEYTIRETILDDVYNAYAIKQRYFKRTPQTLDVFCTTYC